jgi:hypothetical protein
MVEELPVPVNSAENCTVVAGIIYARNWKHIGTFSTQTYFTEDTTTCMVLTWSWEKI